MMCCFSPKDLALQDDLDPMPSDFKKCENQPVSKYLVVDLDRIPRKLLFHSKATGF